MTSLLSNKLPWLNKLFKFIEYSCFDTCLLCRDLLDYQRTLCQSCHDELPWLDQTCQQCAQPLLTTSSKLCGECLKDPNDHLKTFALFQYEQPIDYFINALKFHDKLLYARAFAELLQQQILQHWYIHDPLPQAIIPVPLHVQRLRERGFNQALEIAKPLARALKIPLLYEAIERIRNTTAQSSLPANQRYKNIKNCFKQKKPIPWKHVAVIDDVITTGSTVKEFSKILQQTGVEKIDVWSCAKT